MGMLSALEELDEVVNPEVPEDVEKREFDQAMIAVMEAESELVEETKEIDETNDVMDDVDTSIERLEGLKGAIQKYGISGPMMMAADPSRELVKAGLCVAYEELEEAPVKDENAEAVVEGIKDTMKKIWKKIVDAFRWLGNKIKTWFTRVVQMFTSHEKALIAAITNLKKATVDESKFKDIEVKAYKSSDADKLAKAIKDTSTNIANGVETSTVNELAKLLNNTSSVVTKDDIEEVELKLKEKIKNWGNDVIGLEAKVDNKEVTLTSKKPSVSIESKKLKELGYSTSSILAALNTAFVTIKDSKTLESRMKDLSKNYTDASSTVNKQLSAINGLSDADVSARNKAIGSIKKTLTLSNRVIGANVAASARLSSSALACYRGAMKAA